VLWPRGRIPTAPVGRTVVFGRVSSTSTVLPYPEVGVRLVGENSVQLADAVRAGRLEAGLVALPIDDEGLEVGAPVARLEVVYASADPERLGGAMTIERLAEAALVLSARGASKRAPGRRSEMGQPACAWWLPPSSEPSSLSTTRPAVSRTTIDQRSERPGSPSSVSVHSIV
jgi:hypothetical protein